MTRRQPVARTLRPSLELLREEYVLVQAWKKTVAHIRRHNWFGDTLDLDLTAVDLRDFLSELASAIADQATWKSTPLRLVLAPKRQHWWVRESCKALEVEQPAPQWRPRPKNPCSRDQRDGEAPACCCPRCKGCREKDPCSESKDVSDKLRPLAHVALRDQVLATALMLCLANRVETRQGDPRPPRKGEPSQKKANEELIPFVSYGNRLFCDSESGELRHRWGSTKLYRGFSQDYRRFLGQPWLHAGNAVQEAPGRRAFIVQTDISRFYDQVTPEALHKAIERLQRSRDDPAFFELAKRVLCWEWNEDDRDAIARYAVEGKTRELDRIALPQGLVSAGFWANVALLEFDEALAEAQPSVAHGFKVVHACRYVDDIRIVLTTTDERWQNAPVEEAEEQAKASAADWVRKLLKKHGSDLKLNTDKTEAIEAGEAQPGRVLQSQRMNRIQSRVSGGFSASEGLELLEAIQGLLMIRSGFTRDFDKSQWRHAPQPDVPEDTRTRFGAYRWRKVVRDIRAMLPADTADAADRAERSRPGTSVLTRGELDEMTRSFALVLVDKWVNDPSNVRVLLLALDLWPDPAILNDVLGLLRPWTGNDMGLPDAQRVAWYCLSEVFRAGATETGLFGDQEERPDGLCLADYRRVLIGEAWRIVRQQEPALPWYLRQQALLLLFASESFASRLDSVCRNSDPEHYRTMAAVLAANGSAADPGEFARHAVVLHRCFRKRIPVARWTRQRMEALARRDPTFAADLLRLRDGLRDESWSELAKELLVEPELLPLTSLARLARERSLERDELALLRLAGILLKDIDKKRPEGSVPPWRVLLQEREKSRPAGETTDFLWKSACITDDGSQGGLDLWSPPAFQRCNEHWRSQLGYLLRFALSRSPDFTANVSRSQPPAAAHYRSAVSSWAQRKYGTKHSQDAFGGDWLPVSDWFERFLSALLWWPGRKGDEHSREIDKGIGATKAWIEKRTKRLEEGLGRATGSSFLPMAFSSEYLPNGLERLRACVVQTIHPSEANFDDDLTLSSAPNRSRHRNHLTNALALVRQGLRTRREDQEEDSRDTPDLDLLILPELSVHADDIRRYLVQFAQAFKTIILAGVVFEELPPETTQLVNTAVWVIPEYSRANGWNVRVRRQGKQHLTKLERGRRHQGRPLTGYRPCQWIIECPSSREAEDAAPLRLSAAVCYDATDLALVADLRERSDVFLVPALNKDVQTFDNLAISLSYQMYQLVAVANNGLYGGSSAYWPIGEAHERRLLHLHGQDQPTLGFFEVEDVVNYRRGREDELPPHYKWKSPPAGFPKK